MDLLRWLQTLLANSFSEVSNSNFSMQFVVLSRFQQDMREVVHERNQASRNRGVTLLV
jgi:hypothetical protein